MLRNVDWQMVTFVVGSLIQEYGPYIHLPKVYYLDIHLKNSQDDDKVA